MNNQIMELADMFAALKNLKSAHSFSIGRWTVDPSIDEEEYRINLRHQIEYMSHQIAVLMHEIDPNATESAYLSTIRDVS